MELTFKLILIFAFILSIFLTYDYYSFSDNMSIGVGYAYTAKSLALSRNFNVDEYWGNAGVDVIDANGHKYLAYAPLNSVFMAVPYFVLQVIYFICNKLLGPINGDISVVLESWAMSLPSTLAYVGIGLILYKLLNSQKIKKTNIIISLTGLLFGTILFNYSVSYFNHLLSALFVFLAYYIFTKNNDKKSYFLAGICTGLAFLLEYPTILFCFGVLAYTSYFLVKKEINYKKWFINLGLFAIPVAVAIILLGIFNWYHFGNPFLLSEQILFEQKSLLGTEHSFTQNPLWGIWGLYLSPLKGLFLISPFLLFAVPGFISFYKKQKPLALLAIVYIIFISVLYSMWPDCFGATPFGPRYLISVIPFLSFFSVSGIKNKAQFYLYGILVLYGIYICFFNVLDGLPSGKWFGASCNTTSYASLYKATDYVKDINKNGFKSASVFLDYLEKK